MARSFPAVAAAVRSPAADTSAAGGGLSGTLTRRSAARLLADRRDVDLRETEAPGDVHRGHDRLVRGARIGADRDALAVRGRRDLGERGAQRFRTLVDERPVVDAISAVGADDDRDRIG